MIRILDFGGVTLLAAGASAVDDVVAPNLVSALSTIVSLAFRLVSVSETETASETVYSCEGVDTAWDTYLATYAAALSVAIDEESAVVWHQDELVPMRIGTELASALSRLGARTFVAG